MTELSPFEEMRQLKIQRINAYGYLSKVNPDKHKLEVSDQYLKLFDVIVHSDFDGSPFYTELREVDSVMWTEFCHNGMM